MSFDILFFIYRAKKSPHPIYPAAYRSGDRVYHTQLLAKLSEGASQRDEIDYCSYYRHKATNYQTGNLY